MKPPTEDSGSRVAIIFNGSPLFSGGAGSGESDIRRWIIENDWLEAVVALPEQLFYNTGIATYIWVLTDSKDAKRQGKVQLIDARASWQPMPRSLGNKRRRLSEEHIQEVLEAWGSFGESPTSRVFDNEAFGYHQVTTERPLRLRYRGGPEAAVRLAEMPAYKRVADGGGEKADVAVRLLAALAELEAFDTTDRAAAQEHLKSPLAAAGKNAALRKALWDAVALRDPDAPPVMGRDGRPTPDPELRDTELVPLSESVEDFIAREVQSVFPDAWPDMSTVRVGYEVPIASAFFTYHPPRPVAEIDADLETVVGELMQEFRR